jgi:hypothetical protein
MQSVIMRATVFASLTALSASLVCAQGYSKECSDIYLNEGWLVATCPKDDGNGNITSSVYLPNKIVNNNAVLEVSGRLSPSPVLLRRLTQIQWAIEYVCLAVDPHLLTDFAADFTRIPARTACSQTAVQLCNAPAEAHHLRTATRH